MSKATLNQSQELLKLVGQSDINRDQFQTLLESGRFTALLRDFMDEQAHSKPTIATHQVTVDYTMSLVDMIQAGKYDWVNEDITQEHFPINKRESGKVELQVVHFGCDLMPKEVLVQLDKRGLRSAELPELLALSSAHSELQRKFLLVALGTEWQPAGGIVRVPILNEYNDARSLDLRWSSPAFGWVGRCRFVAVSK